MGKAIVMTSYLQCKQNRAIHKTFILSCTHASLNPQKLLSTTDNPRTMVAEPFNHAILTWTSILLSSKNLQSKKGQKNLIKCTEQRAPVTL